jgi:probable F420-dependent oxidoreductase
MTAPRLGFGLPVSGSWATPETMVDIAQRAEAAGYTSLWTFQRLLNPAQGDYGPMYRAVHDPLLTLAHVAAVTERIRLGAAIVNMPFYSPVLLAKQLTTLDILSRGRLDAGLGLGWSPEEFQATGVPYERRGARGEEFIRCLKAIWADDPVEFEGEFYQVPAAHVLPKPIQRPHPPALMGGTAPAALRRAGRIADGWISSSRFHLDDIAEAIRVVSSAAEAASRESAGFRFVVRGVVDLRDQTDTDRRMLTGTANEIRDDLDQLGETGVTDVFLDLNFHPDVGSPDVDAKAATSYAIEVLETLAPRS